MILLSGLECLCITAASRVNRGAVEYVPANSAEEAEANVILIGLHMAGIFRQTMYGITNSNCP